MTGEITLRGRVLPIGGLTEKLLAAKRGNITHVLIPKDNERDLKMFRPRSGRSLTIDLVEHMDEVLEQARGHEGGGEAVQGRAAGFLKVSQRNAMRRRLSR